MNTSIRYPVFQIQSFEANGFSHPCEGVYHKKILPMLSIVQPLHGYYEVSIDGSPFYKVDSGEIFVAPANVVQEIIHHDGKGGFMNAHWIFVDAVVDGAYRFDEVFSFPVILPKKHSPIIYRLIDLIQHNENTFEQLRAISVLLEILFETSSKKEKLNPTCSTIRSFVKNHFNENIKAVDLAKELICSVSQVFRYTKKYFNLSPANYINLIRLQQAELLLKTTKKTITEISYAVGFSDNAYFQRLFKKHYGQTPQNYRLLFETKRT